MVIKAEFIDDQRIAVQLRENGQAVRQAVREEMRRSAILLANRVTSKKLSGQVLKRQTGTLARSVSASPVVVESGGTVVGVVGTNLPYGRAHEFGFKGPVQVSEHMRDRGGVAQRVRAHLRQVNMPMRSFLRTSLSEFKGQFEARINKAIEGAMK